MIKKSDIIMSLISGILLVFAFPPYDYYPLAWFGLVPLLIAIWNKETKASFFLGILTGFSFFTGTVYWTFHSMYYYGNVPAALSSLLLILLCLYLSLYAGVFSTLFTLLSRNGAPPALFTVPVLWVSLEYLRTYALTGFPWSVLGYSQYKFLPFIQVADITGIYGVSFIVAGMNGAIADLYLSGPRKMGQMPLFSRLPAAIGIVVYIFVLIAVFAYGTWRLNERSEGQTIKASVIQGNIAQDRKWNPRFQKEVIDTYKRLTSGTLRESPEIIVWPESALPFVFGYDQKLTDEILDFQKDTGTFLIFGSVVVKEITDNETKLSNSAILLSPSGDLLSVYDKVHLVPYGEYVPLKTVFPFVEKMVTAIGNFEPGQDTVVMNTPKAKIGNLICYEIIFPGLVRKFVNNGANVLVTITNDAWFGHTSAPYQHFSMAVLRAVENRVPVVRSANTGISGFIDSKGRILNKSDIFVEAALTEDIFLGTEKSFYTKYGDLFVFLCILSTVLLVINRLFPEKKKGY
jgi:apolipoprotein N-acyltransferase